jgi:hypothetical protein
MPSIIPLIGLQPAPAQTTIQVPVTASTYSATNNIATITTGSAHGLTMTPTSPALPNYFVTFGGSTSGLSGTGVLVGNYFAILSIPSTTTFTIYSTITAATVSSMTVIPVFFPSFGLGPSDIGGQPDQTISGNVIPQPFPLLAGCTFNINTGANATVLYNTDRTLIALSGSTTLPIAGTPSTPPAMSTLVPVSSEAQVYGAYPYTVLVCSGSSGTTTLSVIR